MLASARQILSNIGRGDADTISVDDVADPVRIFANTLFNGDGVIPEAAAEDEETRALIREVIACTGGAPDRSGAVGITAEMAEAFFTEARAYSGWYAEGEAEASRVMPLGGEATSAASSAVNALRAKIDDYFARCRLTAFDPRANDVINGSIETYAALVGDDLSAAADADGRPAGCPGRRWATVAPHHVRQPVVRRSDRSAANGGRAAAARRANGADRG